jgi:hypothetical protein
LIGTSAHPRTIPATGARAEPLKEKTKKQPTEPTKEMQSKEKNQRPASPTPEKRKHTAARGGSAGGEEEARQRAGVANTREESLLLAFWFESPPVNAPESTRWRLPGSFEQNSTVVFGHDAGDIGEAS